MGSRQAPVTRDANEGSDDAPLVGEAHPMRLRTIENAALLPDRLARRRRARRLMLRELALLASAFASQRSGRKP